jgi:hypothetical protein
VRGSCLPVNTCYLPHVPWSEHLVLIDWHLMLCHRKKATAAPVLQHSINNMTDVLAKTVRSVHLYHCWLSCQGCLLCLFYSLRSKPAVAARGLGGTAAEAGGLGGEERGAGAAAGGALAAQQRRCAPAAANCQPSYKKKGCANWGFHSYSNSSHGPLAAGARPGHDAGLLSAIAASMLGGGGLGFGAVPFSLMGPPGGAGAEMPPWGGGGARGRRSPAVVARHPPAPPPPPRLPQEFRVEFAAGPTNAHRCCGCGNMLGENLTRIGTRVQGQGGGRRGGSWRWHHLDCLPPGHWREARTTGIANLPSIPAPEQSRVRQHLSLVPR